MDEQPLEELKPENQVSPAHPFFSKTSEKARHPFAGAKLKGKWRTILMVAAIFMLTSGLIYYFAVAKRKGGILIQNISPQEIRISLNGLPARTQPHSQGIYIPAYPGQYRLRLERENYLPFSQDVLLGKNQIVTLKPAFALIPKEEKSEASSVDFVRPSLDQKALFYLGDNRQRIYRLEITSRESVPLTNRPLRGVTNIQWSGEPNLAMITQTDGVYLQEIPLYDFRYQASVKRGGREYVSPIWDPTNPNRIASVYLPGSGERSLIFTDKDFRQLDRKNDLPAELQNPRLIWSPDSAYLLLIGRSGDYQKDNIWLYTTANGDLQQITDGGNILDASFSPDSAKILYETYTEDSAGSRLSLMNADGSGKTALNISGQVIQAAWKDSNSFFLPDIKKGSLMLYTISGQKEDLAFSFPDPKAVQGMFYFQEQKTLIFYTTNAIYTVSLGVPQK